jgi:hypothetical protein
MFCARASFAGERMNCLALISFEVALVAFLVTATPATSIAAGLDRWHWLRPLPQGNTLGSVAHADGKWVVLGELDTVLNSTNRGATWQVQQLGRFDFQSVAFGNGVFVAIGGKYRVSRGPTFRPTGRIGEG